jgi:ribonuclease HII
MKAVIGIDEVGRGPVAGPVALCAFRLSAKIRPPILGSKPVPLRDSKKLTPLQREAWYKHLLSLKKQGKCDFAVSMQSASLIDSIGISPCIKKALATVLKKLDATIRETILLDGSLYAPKEFKKQKTIIKGDEKEPAIGLASIVAKVTRDRYMLKMAGKHPLYGFENHVGYGTKKHYLAIKKHGMTDIHRKSFLKRVA